MSVLPQFRGMRERHDEHRKTMGDRTVMGSTWSDCDACLAIAAFDEADRAVGHMPFHGDANCGTCDKIAEAFGS